MSEIKYEIKNELGVLSTNESKGWTKEINLISWNGADPKFDVRDWAPGKEKMGKGVTLTEAEALELRKVLNNYFSYMEDEAE